MPTLPIRLGDTFRGAIGPCCLKTLAKYTGPEKEYAIVICDKCNKIVAVVRQNCWCLLTTTVIKPFRKNRKIVRKCSDGRHP